MQGLAPYNYEIPFAVLNHAMSCCMSSNSHDTTAWLDRVCENGFLW